MMRHRWIMTCTGLALGCAMVGCQDNIKKENSLLKEENTELRAQYSEAVEALSAADQDLQRSYEELRAERELAESLANRPPEVTMTIFEQIEGVDASLTDKELTLTVASDLLFNSGSASLRSSAKSTLSNVAGALQSRYPNKSIVIKGYTDSDPIKKSGFKSNWHLAFDRAWAVRNYLVAKGINEDRMAIESFGPTHPLGTKAASRRVDIVVVDS